MKNRVILIISTIMLVVSCSGFLDEKPTTDIFHGMYDSEEMLEADIYGILGRFYQHSSEVGEGAEYLNLSSGLVHHGLSGSAGNTKTYYTSCLDYTQYPSSTKNYAYFRWCYDVIGKINLLLENLPSSPVNEDYKKQIEAEAIFYRAFIMFRLVRVWGDCPIKTEAPSIDNVAEKRAPYYKVYCKIVQDLEYAFNHMRRPDEVDRLTPNKSRVHKYAAAALLSNVYVTIGSLLTSPNDNFWDETREDRKPDFTPIDIRDYTDAYEKALYYSEMLIPESESHAADCPYALAPHFGDLFNFSSELSASGYNGWNNPERIFVLPITKQTYNTLAQYTLPPYTEGTDFLADAVSTNNGRWRPNRWVFQQWCETYPGEYGTGKSAKIYISSADPRLDLTMYHTSIYNQKTEETLMIYPDETNLTSSKYTSVFPYFRKYWSRRYAGDYGEADKYLIRLAEIYFNAAEASAELGFMDKAYDYVEYVHKRARKSVAPGEQEAEMPEWKRGSITSIKEMRTALFWERIYELYGEGHEWDETHRHGAQWIIDNISTPKNDFLNKTEQSILHKSGYVYPISTTPFQYSTDVKKVRQGLLYGYPTNELTYNSSLSADDQNDFYFDM